eukprot:CAMPEP_0172467114 /NCGR_PEP_ID=MMETSP1065-20121228/57979_1 /TAXON_ID=265537 /ORGANISM="Amphiprora paludosa, Strain CCMP125" /LENGTH=463 /DNA_ID=CAMNT_0013224161 /DNA_START=163 /DNA_END=1554 /DNA_ORIENTATION=+
MLGKGGSALAFRSIALLRQQTVRLSIKRSTTINQFDASTVRRLYHTSPSALLASKTGDSRTKAVSFSQELTDVKRQVEEAITLCEKNRKSTTPIHQLKEAIADLEKEQSDPTFWDEENSSRANQVNTQFSSFTRMISRLDNWKSWQGDAQAALEMILNSGEDDGESLLSDEERDMLLEECKESSKLLLEDNQRYELDLLLSGPFDQSPARLVLTAGAGGTESNDWVADLKRMYERHCEAMGFSCVTEDYQTGDVVGFKSVDLLITGPNAYGWFQGEKGAHRLVRLSPFNANNKRQTTFAGVDVAPSEIFSDSLDTGSFEIPDNDLEITTMRSGGAGGQNVNKVNSAVRIKHIPSGLQVKCSQERSQPQNKVIALERLKAQLIAVAQEQRVKEINEIRGDMVEASWGAQIRNYVLHPYKMIKDQRTGWESSNAQAFLDGDLEDCIGAYLRYKSKQEREESSTAS